MEGGGGGGGLRAYKLISVPSPIGGVLGTQKFDPLYLSRISTWYSLI